MAPKILFLNEVPFLTLTLKIPLYFSIFLVEAFFKLVCIKVVFENCPSCIPKNLSKNSLYYILLF